MRRALVAFALLALAACTGNRPPVDPPQTPVPLPPAPQCVEGQNTCCWHQPPGNEWLFACPAPELPGGVLNVAGGPAQCPAQRCGGTQPPDPPPVPGEARFKELELRQPTPPRLARGGQPFEPFGAIQCCMGFNLGGAEQNSRWPLASESWMDFTKANFFHFRMGPFYGDADHESEWADIGGPYVGSGPEWNQAFWAEARKLAAAAGARKANVEVVPIDTWYCKHAASNWGDQQMPWPQADIDACGITSSPEQERYIRKVVSELGCFANVVWLTDNEGGEINGTKRSWYEWVRNTIRDEELKSGCGVVHLVGTNNTDFADGPFDFVATHDNAPLLAPVAGKHTENNERNGRPQVTPQEEYSRFCQARAKGLHYWFWRAEMTDSQMDEALRLMRAGCDGDVAVGCYPPPDGEQWELVGAGGPGTRKDEVQAAQAQLGSMCAEPRAHENGNVAIAALNDQLRKNGLCAGTVGAVDHAMVLEEDGKTWGEYHAVAPYDTGCWSTSNGHYPLNRFRYNGPWSPPTQPSTACANPSAVPVDHCIAKEHTKGPNWTTLDVTFKVHSAEYCAAIGSPNLDCPVRLEGDPLRETCEAEVVGTPQWSGLGGIVDAENPYLYRVPRGSSGPVKVCASKNPGVCCSAQATP